MRAFECRKNPFALSECIEALEGVVVFASGVAHSASVFPITVFRPNAWIIEACRNRMHVAGLTIFILHYVAKAAVQNTRRAVAQRRRMIARTRTAAAGFD